MRDRALNRERSPPARSPGNVPSQSRKALNRGCPTTRIADRDFSKFRIETHRFMANHGWAPSPTP